MRREPKAAHVGLHVINATMSVLLGISCGARIAQQGVLVNHLDLSRSSAGESPADIAQEGYIGRTAARFKWADVIGDDAPELLWQLERGAGIEVRDAGGRTLAILETPHYLTDFGAVLASRPDKSDVVLYTYPATPERGGRFTIIAMSDRHIVATWDVYPATEWFAVGQWHGREALFYLQRDVLTVRAADGRLLAEVTLPGAETFSRVVQVRTTSDGHLAVLISGDGYTPYHMMALLNTEDRLAYQEIARENAYRLEVDEQAHVLEVWTKSRRWRYAAIPEDVNAPRR
jgi:hypothetical protein